MESVLQDQINALSDLHSKLNAIRQIPAGLLRRPILANKDIFSGAPVHSVKADFEQLKEVGDVVRSDIVQKALIGAQERIEADGTHLDTNYRRDNRKRRRAPSPESPKPYVPADRTRTSFFRAQDAEPAPVLYAEGLVQYAREFNKTQETCRLHIWEKTRDRREDKPRMLRFSIPDVLVAYLSLGYSSSDKAAIVHLVTVFGPREKKPPHSQSEFGVFQQVSQEIAKMMQTQERVLVGDMVGLLCCYEDLFYEPCAECGRLLSVEGHSPPVVRIWRGGRREARHVRCTGE
ncbi:hypothetical protein D9611_000165 [Ephemerocybe angulata]|uniref:Uncharacterized protein n=1 Tax=Ephemerocybe angulata TaxID=980116 RepID=A0A8H5F768_9AGAR|nr:hypothetical protein D9611_000165 [Tulosesus angulatus]